MKKKLILLSSVAVLAIGGVVYGLNHNSDADCPLMGTSDCPMEKTSAVSHAGIVSTDASTAKDDKSSITATEKSKTGCPMVGDCCKKH